MDELYSAVATTAAIYRGSKGVVGSKPSRPAGGAADPPAAAASAPASAPGGSAAGGAAGASSAPAAAAPLAPLNPDETVFPYGQAPLDTREALAKYLREDHGQGPSFVKCTSYTAPAGLTRSLCAVVPALPLHGGGF